MQDHQTNESLVAIRQLVSGSHLEANQDHNNHDEELGADLDRLGGDNDDGGDVYLPSQQTLLSHRLSPVDSIPVSSSPAGTPTVQSQPVTQTPLTNHEVYELIQQKNQQQQQVVGATLQNSNASNIMSAGAQGSFKQVKRQSLYTHHQQNRALERQTSVIVGTPGFRERYGE